MAGITLEKDKIQANLDYLKNVRDFYSNQKINFNVRVSSAGFLTTCYAEIRSILDDLVSNIDNVYNYILDYKDDVDALSEVARGLSSAHSIKAPFAYRRMLDNANFNRYLLDEAYLFAVQEYKGSHTSAYYGTKGQAEVLLANTTVCLLSLTEGILNIGEMIIDGGAMIAATACSLGGNDYAANKIGDFVRTDWTKQGYNWVTSVTGLDQYADPNSAGAQICSSIGTIGGMVVITIATGGTGATVFGALSNMGAAGESALNRGATIEQAEGVSWLNGAIGAGTGWLGNQFAGQAGIAGANKAIGGIVKYSGLSFASAGSEPVLNCLAETAIYRNEKGKNFFESFLNNAQEDNLGFQVLLSGGGQAVGAGLKGYNSYRKAVNIRLSDQLERILDVVEVKTDLDSTVEMIKIDKLKAILNDDAALEKFLDLPDSSREKKSLATGLKQLLRADHDLTDSEIRLANSIVNKYAVNLGAEGTERLVGLFTEEDLFYNLRSDNLNVLKSTTFDNILNLLDEQDILDYIDGSDNTRLKRMKSILLQAKELREGLDGYQTRTGDFLRSTSGDGKFGASQGGLYDEIYIRMTDEIRYDGFDEDLFNYLVNNKKYSEKDAFKIIDSINESYDYIENLGMHSRTEFTLENFIEDTHTDKLEAAKILNDSFEKQLSYKNEELVQKLVAQGMDRQTAIKTLNIVDSKGACSYASAANSILVSFKDNPELFKKTFGYDMYTTINGKQALNSSELLLDMYTSMNNEASGGSIFRTIDGKTIIVGDASQQLYMSNFEEINEEALNKFLQSKNPNISLSGERFQVVEPVFFEEDITPVINKNLINRMQNGENISLGIYATSKDHPVRFCDPISGESLVSSFDWGEGGAHSVFLTGTTDKGLLVSSWGKEYLLPYEDLHMNTITFNSSRLEGV